MGTLAEAAEGDAVEEEVGGAVMPIALLLSLAVHPLGHAGRRLGVLDPAQHLLPARHAALAAAAGPFSGGGAAAAAAASS